MNSLIIDTNIVASSLISPGRVARIFDIAIDSLFVVYSDLLTREIEIHWERILQFSRFTEAEVKERYGRYLKNCEQVNLEAIPKEYIVEAESACKKIDPDDFPLVALSLWLGIPIWTGDLKLKKGLELQGYFICLDSDAMEQSLKGLS